MSAVDRLSSWYLQLPLWAQLCLVLGVSFLTRLGMLYFPMGDIDESQFSEYAMAIMNGGLPYVDHVGEKPPFMYYFFVLSFVLFGDNAYVGTHWLTQIWFLLTLTSIYLLASRLSNHHVGLVAVFLYAIWATVHEFSIISTNGATLYNFPLILGFYAFVRSFERDRWARWGWLLVSAGLIAFAAHFRQQAWMQGLVQGIIIIAWFIFTVKTRFLTSLVYRVIDALAMLLGVLLVWSLTALWLGFTGTLDDMFWWNFDYNFKYISQGDDTVSLLANWGRWTAIIVLWFPLYFLAAQLIVRRGKLLIQDIWRRKISQIGFTILAMSIWFIFTAWTATIGWRMWTHYFLHMFPALVIMASMGLYAWLEDRADRPKARHRRRPWLVTVGLAALAVGITQPLHLDHFTLMRHFDSSAPDDDPWSGYVGIFEEQKYIGEYIRDRTELSDRIYVWGFATPIYYWAERYTAGRYAWSNFMVGKVPGAFDAGEWQYRIRYLWEESEENAGHGWIEGKSTWDELMSDLNHFRPAYFVDTAPGDYHEFEKFDVQNPNYIRLQRWLNSHYEFEIRINGADLWRRTD